MKTQTSFKELSESRQWEIVENLTGDDWHEDVISDYERELHEMGFLEPKIEFTGFYSQGDGASFTCESVDLPVLLRHLIKEGFNHQSPQMEAAHDGIRTMAALIGWDALDVPRPVLDLVYELEDNDLFTISIWRSGHRYYHERSTELSVELNSVWDADGDRDIQDYRLTDRDMDELHDFQASLESFLEDWMVNKNREIYNKLEETYDEVQESILNDLKEENDEWSETGNSRW